MDRRVALAIGLMLIVAILPSVLFPPERPTPRPQPDSVRAEPDSQPVLTPQPTPPPLAAPPIAPPPEVDSVRPDTRVIVRSPIYTFVFSTRGARLVAATLENYRSFAPRDSAAAQLIPPNSRFLDLALVFGNDTVALRDWAFEPSAESVSVEDEVTTLRFTGASRGLRVNLEYRFRPDSYRFDVEGAVSGAPGSGLVLIGLGPRIVQVEADSAANYRSYAVVTKAGKTESLKFSSLDPGEVRALNGPFEWIAVKSKYFVTAIFTVDEGLPQLGGAVATGGDRSGKNAVNTSVTSSLPSSAGAFQLSAYVGPQEYRRLSRIGHDFEDINPYGWIFRPVIRPFANAIVVVLLWMHETLSLAYGWVLILFGLAVRVVLWPLNQKAMRSSMAMQAIQPEMKALQERHKNDPQRLQQEMMKLYKEHQVNPLGGCLPLLIPMPVLFALFFVFQETIEFRGVPFLWLPDLSRADPIFIIPVVMGLSMFAVTKIGQRGVPPNPQAKMMLYFMPAFLTFIFLNLSSGLNLYYAVSNIASIPQQWLIAKERVRRVNAAPAKA